MLNFDRIVSVLIDELGESGAQAVADAVGLYLKDAQQNASCPEEVYLLWCLFYCCDIRGLNYLQKEYDPLYGMKGVCFDFAGGKDGSKKDPPHF